MEILHRSILLPSSTLPGLLFRPAPLRQRVTQGTPKDKLGASCRSCLFLNGPPSRWQQHGQRKQVLCPVKRGGGVSGGAREVVATAKKKKKSSKSDAGGFLAGEGEVFFPEAVLLKKKIVHEDGRVLPEFADAEEEKLFEFLNLQLEKESNLEKMRHYEVVYLIHEDHSHEVDDVISKVQDFIREKRGKIWRLNNWGIRRLAYKIKKAKNANYILMNFELDAKCINDFKGMLDKEERIIRHLVMKRDTAITEDCPPPLEFHTMRAGGDDDDHDDDEDYDDEGWGARSGLDDVNSDDDFGANIIMVDEAEENDLSDEHAKISRRARATP